MIKEIYANLDIKVMYRRNPDIHKERNRNHKPKFQVLEGLELDFD